VLALGFHERAAILRRGYRASRQKEEVIWEIGQSGSPGVSALSSGVSATTENIIEIVFSGN
jgi:hypothetical protein